MNWKKFGLSFLIFTAGFAVMVLFSFGVIWLADTFGIWWVLGGGMLAFVIFISAIVGMTDRDSLI